MRHHHPIKSRNVIHSDTHDSPFPIHLLFPSPYISRSCTDILHAIMKMMLGPCFKIYQMICCKICICIGLHRILFSTWHVNNREWYADVCVFVMVILCEICTGAKNIVWFRKNVPLIRWPVVKTCCLITAMKQINNEDYQYDEILHGHTCM